jgi:hypothetical protein
MPEHDLRFVVVHGGSHMSASVEDYDRASKSAQVGMYSGRVLESRSQCHYSDRGDANGEVLRQRVDRTSCFNDVLHSSAAITERICGW